MAFFGEFGDEIRINDALDFSVKFSKIDCSVPKRTEGRKSIHREKHCLKHYLDWRLSENLLKFPLVIKKEESPDFFISHGNESFFLEVTDAGREDSQRAKTERAKKGGVRHIEINEDNEEKWCKIILDAFKKKNEKGYKKDDSSRLELLIYDNSDESSGLSLIGNDELLEVLDSLADMFKRISKCSFNVVTIMNDRWLYSVVLL